LVSRLEGVLTVSPPSEPPPLPSFIEATGNATHLGLFTLDAAERQEFVRRKLVNRAFRYLVPRQVDLRHALEQRRAGRAEGRDVPAGARVTGSGHHYRHHRGHDDREPADWIRVGDPPPAK
jgi:hypothetical protein